MKSLPNAISALRFLGAIGLLFFDVKTTAFCSIYFICGISDILDGYLARKLHCESKTGALLDSLADLAFVACCCYKLTPSLVFPKWLWIWGGAIVAIKVINQISALVMYKKCLFPHTPLLRFLLPLLPFKKVISLEQRKTRREPRQCTSSS